VIQLVYISAALISAALPPITPEALQLLLTKARAANAIHKVTGMLLYDSGSFLQVLEGPAAGVDHIFDCIQRDPRHHQIRVRLRQPTEVREFPDWTMGFIDTSKWVVKPGLIDYRRLPELVAAPTAAQRYLRLFHQGLCRQAVCV
jgi:hypothetical protein